MPVFRKLSRLKNDGSLSLKYLFLALFAVAAVFHIITLIFGFRRLRKISKVLLMPLLAGYYLFAAQRLLPPVLAAAIFGWIGDILLIKSNRTIRFMLGILGFLLGHLCYIWSIWQFIGIINVRLLITAAIIGLGLVVFIIRVIHPPKLFTIPGCFYAAALETLSISALCLLLYRKDILGAFVFAGSLLFLVSDFILSYYTFRRFPRFGHLAVMATYLAAQSGIVISLAWM
jgi:uncharacterized membrane protein YhhN